MVHMRCVGHTILCNDTTCKQYRKHYSCDCHPLHIGDRITRKSDGKTGYIYDANPYGSKRSIVIMWDDLANGESGTLVWGHKVCIDFEKIDGPRTTKKTSNS